MFIDKRFYLDSIIYETDSLIIFLDGYLLWPSKYMIVPGEISGESSYIQFTFKPHNGQYLCINNIELNAVFYYEFQMMIEGELELIKKRF
jgi:hypothetical protein